MARMIPENEWNEILQSLSSFPVGASLKEIHESLKEKLPRYTLLRRLTTLVKEGKVETFGKARNLHYRLKQDIRKNKLLLDTKQIIPYQRKFLDSYKPNITKYLPDAACQKLFNLGKTDGFRPAGTYAKQVLHRLIIDLSWNSSRLEGNTYSLLETEKLLEFNQIAEGKDLKETKMILNHKDAIEFLVNSAPEIGINRYTILNLHAILSNDLLQDIEACGRLRSIAIGITGTNYRPLAIPQLIQEIFEQILNTANEIKDPFELAFFLMVHLPYLQAFEDVNKRVSRLAANIPLIKNNLCPLSFIDVQEQSYINGLLSIYETNQIDQLRDVFISAYERSCLRYSTTRKELGDPDPFKMRYREAITIVILEIVHQCMDKTSAIAFIRSYASSIASEDRARFIEIVEKDLMGLHEGNIARHRIRPSEYQAWIINWH